MPADFHLTQPVPELPVTNIAASQAYYRQALGFDGEWTYPDGSIGGVTRGEVAIFLRKRGQPFEPAVHWIFSLDVDRAHAELQARGARIVDPIENKPWGLRQFTVEDLDGNRFHVHHDLGDEA